jgi:Kdo2-lipid IVA lauroyltransferase/acyltransferase
MRLILGLLASLPLSALHALGTVLGWAMYGMSPTYRRHVRENLESAGYGDARVRRAAIAHAGRAIMEVPALWFRPQDKVAALVRQADGVQAAFDARQAGKALVFLTPHLGAFEVAAQYAAQRIPITVLYRRPKMAWLDPLMRAGRARGNLRLATADSSGVRQLIGALKRGEAVGFLPDQVPGKGEGEWSEFFGKPAYTMTLASRLAERENVATFLAFAKRLPRGAGYSIHVKRLDPKHSINRAIEELVRECPEQYLWGYNRYKIPGGVPPPPL